MTVLITGAYGFVGTNLCRALAAHGHTCHALDVARGDAPYAAFHTWDALDALPWSSFDAVVHLAGKAHDTRNAADEKAYFDINLGLTQRVFSACAGRTPRFVFFSSVKACADRVDAPPLAEDAPCRPATPYGRSKRVAEEWLAAQDTKGTEVFILRPAMIHGPGNKGNLNLLCKVAEYGLPWPLAAFANARSFTSVGNACAVVEALCAGTAAPGTYNLCDDEALSVNRLMDLIGAAFGGRARLWRLPPGLMRGAARAGDILHLPLNTERLRKLTESYEVSNANLKRALGWARMPVAAEDGLRATLAALCDRGRRLRFAFVAGLLLAAALLGVLNNLRVDDEKKVHWLGGPVVSAADDEADAEEDVE